MIRIQNIYYMLAYAFRVLNAQGYKSIATESFENTSDLFAEILIRGIRLQLKRGLGREYIQNSEALSSLRGKIDISQSIKTQTHLKKQLICEYDDFSTDSVMNRIIKSTVYTLFKANIQSNRKKELKKLMLFFDEVSTVDLHTVAWNFRYNRNNQTYRMLISVCYLIVKGLLQTQSDGTAKLMDFIDEQRMCRLYEKFVLEYYRKEHPEISANASKIDWQLDDGFDFMLPDMQSDIMLTYNDKVLIIDAKYYSRTTQKRYDKNTLHSANLYQIFTYVKNKAVDPSAQHCKVSGMLLYAKTNEETFEENEYSMSGNKIIVKTLDLDKDFGEIKKQLDDIIEKYLF